MMMIMIWQFDVHVKHKVFSSIYHLCQSRNCTRGHPLKSRTVGVREDAKMEFSHDGEVCIAQPDDWNKGQRLHIMRCISAVNVTYLLRSVFKLFKLGRLEILSFHSSCWPCSSSQPFQQSEGIFFYFQKLTFLSICKGLQYARCSSEIFFGD